MLFRGIEFDDVTKGDEGYWSQVCEQHYYDLNDDSIMDESPSDTAICGVEGCNNTAKYYVNFPTEEVPL